MKEAEEAEQEASDPNKPKMYGAPNFDHFANRNEKIAMFRKKKDIETLLTTLKDYKDEDMKREFYNNQLLHSIIKSIEFLDLIASELKLLDHQQSLPRDPVSNQPVETEKYVPKPMKVLRIPVSSQSSKNIFYIEKR